MSLVQEEDSGSRVLGMKRHKPGTIPVDAACSLIFVPFNYKVCAHVPRPHTHYLDYISPIRQ